MLDNLISQITTDKGFRVAVAVIAAALLLIALSLAYIALRPIAISTANECILHRLSDMQSEQAARALVGICRQQYP